MKTIIVKDEQAGGQVAFEIVAEKLQAGAKVLGLATGSTPLAFYKKLRESDLDFRGLTSVNLDEYVGLAAKDPQSYRYFMDKELFESKPFAQSFLPDGLAEDLTAEVARYNQILDAHPIDVQILGIGQNGHIGFNEPGSDFESRTRVVDLAPSTIAANARFFEEPSQVPKQAISMGIRDIMQAKTIILMAYGSNKAEAVEQLITGPVSSALPASVLQHHADVIIIMDEAAAEKLEA